MTPPTLFARLVPWLVLAATGLFAWDSFFQKPLASGKARLPPLAAALVQIVFAICGGYFGGGIGFLMLASLTMTGLAVRRAAASKNILPR